MRTEEVLFLFWLSTYCYGLADVFVERMGFGIKLCIPHTGMVSLQNESADERQHVRGKAEGNQLVLIIVIIAHFLDWILEGISLRFETSGTKNLNSHSVVIQNPESQHSSY